MGVVLAGWIVLSAGCARSGGTVLGAPPGHSVKTIADARTAAISTPITLHGTMTQKCPVAGCWFYIQDPTGSIRVDTKTAGFVVLKVPLREALTVSGKVRRENGDTIIQASGIRY